MNTYFATEEVIDLFGLMNVFQCLKKTINQKMKMANIDSLNWQNGEPPLGNKIDPQCIFL